MIAHIRQSDGKEQTWAVHSHNVSKLCADAAKTLALSHCAALIGLLHDFGKGTNDFQAYLRGTSQKHPTHSNLGALYALLHWYNPKNTEKTRAAQLISLCIIGHHAGLPDCLNAAGTSPYLEELKKVSGPDYTEAMQNFYTEIMPEEKLDALFAAAYEELEHFTMSDTSFSWGMLTRLLLSILIDADRWDTACFAYDADPLTDSPNTIPNWETLLDTLETYLAQFPQDTKLAKIRHDISAQCKAAGTLAPDIYTLSVPTGGGKTYSSLRFALSHAKQNHQRKIFYCIPMNTILDQNAQDIRKALNDYPAILEHHSDVTLEGSTQEEEISEQEAYRKLTERWDSSDIILTSLVQFLDTLFQNGNSKVRRMHRLTNAVLIFDEIQALPKKCTELFEKALTFLVHSCHCTVLLCTATQPSLNLNPKELVANADTLRESLQRVHYIPDFTQRTYEQAASDITAFLEEKQSVLTIVNTKSAALKTFESVSKKLQDNHYTLTEMQNGLSDEALQARAAACPENEILCVHLSTLMCPMHRKEILRWVKAWLQQKKRVFCISTALIEAGINISFPVVIRSLTGIPSMIQAAGRCNRNYEAAFGNVYLWNFAEEKLAYVPEIQNGNAVSRSILAARSTPYSLENPEILQTYFKNEEENFKPHGINFKKYPYPSWNSNLVDMLSENPYCISRTGEHALQFPFSESLRQSFRTAGDVFQVIDQKTTSILVPYGEGKALIEKLTSQHSLSEEILYLKKAQQYSVNLYDNIITRLEKENALYHIPEIGITILNSEYYKELTGVATTEQEQETLIF